MCPGLGVEIVEGLIVVAWCLWKRLLPELCERSRVPGPKMIGKHTDRVICIGVGFAIRIVGDPSRLVWSKPIDGRSDGYEPFGFVV